MVVKVTYDEIIETIITSDPVHDWIFTDNAVILYKHDVNLRIEHEYERDLENNNFIEEWANKHPDKHAYSSFYRLYYSCSLIENLLLVTVDGGRATLPLPNLETMTPDLLAWRVAEIVNYREAHEYAKRSGFNLPQ